MSIGRWLVQVIAVAFEAISQEQDVAKTIGVDDAELWPAALDDSVGRDRRAVDEQIDIARQTRARTHDALWPKPRFR